MKDVWAEIDPKQGKVSWPKKNEIVSATMIIIVSIFVIGFSIGLIDNLIGKLFALFIR